MTEPSPEAADLRAPATVVPIATPVRLPSGKYALLEGELELRPEASLCPHCGTDLAAIIRGLRIGAPGMRWVIESHWERARRKIGAWLGRQQA